MAISLPSTLAAHLRGSQRRPHLLASSLAQRASVDILQWERIYTGSEPDAPHASAVVFDPAVGDTLVRARNDSGSIKVNAARAAEGEPFSTWATVATATAGTPVALARRFDDVLCLLYVDSASLKLQLRTSADFGSTWSAATLLATEASAISALALAASPADNSLCAFYVLAGGTTLKRLRCSSAGVWAGSGTNWTRSASVNSLSGVSACHDGNDFALVVTGKEVTTTHPRAWAVAFGDGNAFPLDAWTGLRAIAEADALSTVTFKAPAITPIGLSFAGFFTQSEAGNVAVDRVHYSYPPATAGVVTTWREPSPHQATGPFGVSACGPIPTGFNCVYAASPSAIWRAGPLGIVLTLTDRVVSATYTLTAESARCTLTLDNHDGSLFTAGAFLAGNTLHLQPGYRSGTAAAPEYGVTQEFVIERITHQLSPGQSVTIVGAGGGWEQLARWRAPQAWQVNAGVMTRAAIFGRVANRAGLEWAAASGDESPSTDWTTFQPAFAIAQGESGSTILRRLLAVVPDYIRANGSTLEALTPGSTIDATFTLPPNGTDLDFESYTFIVEEAQPANWVRVQGPDRYADSVAFADLYQNGPAFRQVRNLDANTDQKAENWAANAARRDVIDRPWGQLVCRFHPALQLFDPVEITHPTAGTHDYHVTGISMKYSRGPKGPTYTTTLTLGGL